MRIGWPEAELHDAVASGRVSADRVRDLRNRFGNLVTDHALEIGYARIINADPVVLLPGYVVREALAVPLPADMRQPQDCVLGALRLVIVAETHRVIYRIGAYLADVDCYEASWPD